MKHKFLFCIFFVLVYTSLLAQKSEKKNPNFHTFLGVDVDNTSIKTNGLYVNGVYKGFGAEKAGVKRGDSLMAIDGAALHSFDQLVKTLDKYQAGDNIELFVIRNHQAQKITATVSAYPEFLKYNSMQWAKEMNEEGKHEIKIAKLGVEVDPIWDKYAAKVREVVDNSAAANAGIEAGDIILKMDNYEFATMEELKYYLSRYKAGDMVTLSLLHNSEVKSVKVRLGEEIVYLNYKKDKDKNKN